MLRSAVVNTALRARECHFLGDATLALLRFSALVALTSNHCDFTHARDFRRTIHA
jgi:hypothetical protein